MQGKKGDRSRIFMSLGFWYPFNLINFHNIIACILLETGFALGGGGGGYKTGGDGACEILPLRKRGGGGHEKVYPVLRGRGGGGGVQKCLDPRFRCPIYKVKAHEMLS